MSARPVSDKVTKTLKTSINRMGVRMMMWKLDIIAISANGIREAPAGSERSPETPQCEARGGLSTHPRKASVFRERP